MTIALPLLMLVAVLHAQAPVKHPSLLYTAERIEEVKLRMKDDPTMATAWKELKRTADVKVKDRKIADLDYLSLVYLMTGEKVYVERIKEILLDAVRAETWGSTEMLARKPAWRADLGLSHKA